MKFGKRRKDAEPADDPAAAAASEATPPRTATESWIPAEVFQPPRTEPEPEPAEPDPVVVGEAVDVTAEPEPAVAPAAAPEPVARPVVAPPPSAATHGSGPTPLSATAAAGAPVADGHGPEPLMDPLKQIAAERPEVVVGAAFAGGILAAMILRHLGN